MLHPGQEISAVVESLGFQGEGVCRVKGFVLFVPYALPGEEVLLRIEEVKKNHALASLVKVFSFSPDRQAPRCLVFGKCGGCSMQHLAYEQQLELKRQGIENTLYKISGIKLKVLPVIGMKEPWHYRNKTTWQVAAGAEGFKTGFFAGKSHDLVVAEGCAIASEASNKAVKSLVSWLNRRFPDREKQPDSPVSELVTRNDRDGKLMLLLGCDAPDLPYLSELADDLCKSLPELVSVYAYAADDRSKEARHLSGRSALTEQIDGLNFSLSPFSFYQVNHEIMEEMYRYALSQAEQDKNDTLVDIYSGIGTISMLASKHFKQVIGLELSKSAVQDARISARNNKLTNTAFISGFAERELPKLTASGLKANAIILDPPKKGAHSHVLSAMMDAKPDRIIYISCHPASQARDAAILMKGGYEPVASQPFDMFPQTGEIENVMTFRRRTI
ncbi:MAG: 23S rRNA (uracil(1939)-C(5))-methyltransferase RlmD [Bacillota bacterium]|nr:23S rRNA (uracil(1939)-C(5))-methyltransferase RlmD [Bacillota bacterium]